MLCEIAIIPANERSGAVNIIYRYRTQEVRDLAAACFSPPLLHVEQLASAAAGITTCYPTLTPERRLWLERLDHDASALLSHLSLKPTHRLGVYFEQLWHFFLKQDPATELVAHNLTVTAEDRTVGEFDCIYYCHQRALHVHLELAVKFYLGIPRISNHEGTCRNMEWLGPDSVDRLDAKLDQLLHRQIMLGDNPIARHKLQELGIRKLLREVALRGCLFEPFGASATPPPAYNTDCELGTWVSIAQLPRLYATLDNAKYVILPRMKWLCAAASEDARELLDAQQMQRRVLQHFARDSHPLLVAIMGNPMRPPFFITPDTWPASTAHTS